VGLYFVRARYYDAGAGRWVSEDPLGFAAGDANLYPYCANDPVNQKDPSGLMAMAEPVRPLQPTIDPPPENRTLPANRQSLRDTLVPNFEKQTTWIPRGPAALITESCCTTGIDANWQWVVSLNAQAPLSLWDWLTSIFCRSYAYIGNLVSHQLNTFSRRGGAALDTVFGGIAANYNAGGQLVLRFLRALGEGSLQLGSAVVRASHYVASGFAGYIDEFTSALDSLWTELKTLTGDGFSTILQALVNDPVKVKNNILQGTSQGIQEFFSPADALLENIQGILSQWASAEIGVDSWAKFPQSLEASAILQFALELAGLTWENVTAIGWGVAGATPKGQAMMEWWLTQAAEWGANPEGPQIPTAQQIAVLLSEGDVNEGELTKEVPAQLVGLLEGTLVEAAIKVALSLVPLVGGALNVLYSGAQTIYQNLNKVVQIFAEFRRHAVTIATTTVAQAAQAVKAAIGISIGLGLTLGTEFLANALGLGKLKRGLQCIIQFIRDKINELIRKVFEGLLRKGKKPTKAPGKPRCGEGKKGGKVPPNAMGCGLKKGCSKGSCGQCFVVGTPLHCGATVAPIEQVRLADVVRTRLPQECPDIDVQPATRIDPATWRTFALLHERSPGDRVEIELLRGPAWMAEHHPAIGGWVWLDLSEMGVQGLAEVTRIDACPPIPDVPPGYGLVTALFRHRAEQVWALRLVGSEEIIQGTAAHAFWSHDRQEWVSLSELRPSEQLSGLAGPVQVEAVTLVAEPQPVYNIEVEGDHCYRVGQQGLLVHNSSVGCPCDEKDIAASLKGDSAAKLHVYDMSVNNGNFASKVKSITSADMQAAGKGVIYILKDEAGVILKVGSTVLAEPTFSDRFYKYSAAVDWLNTEWKIKRTVTAYFVVCDVVAPSTLRTIESAVRKHFTGLPWDNEGQRLNRRGKGVPGITPARRDVNRMCVWVGEEWRRITDQELRDWVAMNGAAAWAKFAEHYGLEPRHAKDAQQWYNAAQGRNFMGDGTSDPCITT
jgi:hypothetical protein